MGMGTAEYLEHTGRAAPDAGMLRTEGPEAPTITGGGLKAEGGASSQPATLDVTLRLPTVAALFQTRS